MFDTDVYQRKNHTPWARMNLFSFMKEMALNKPDDTIESVKIEVVYRHSVASRFWWRITWWSEEGTLCQTEGQELDLCLWRAAEMEMRIRRRLEIERKTQNKKEEGLK
jgi:hypothetical protein